jgi:hypothetical protein
MIHKNLHKLKIEKSNSSLTSFAGLPLLTELAHNCGLIRAIDSINKIWRRRHKYSTSDYVMSLALTIIAGGERLDDTRLLRADEGISKLALSSIPAANTIGDFLRRFSNRDIASLANAAINPVSHVIKNLKTVTVDIDSSLIESNKENAAFTYKKFSGYNPMLAWVPEADIFLACLFRDGNSSPQSHILQTLKYCEKQISNDKKIRFRSDSAGYQIDLMRHCHDNNIDFTITADMDVSVKEVIANIPTKDWRLIVKDKETLLMAETVHAPGSTSKQKKLPSFRLIVTRKLSCQLELFKDIYIDRAIITNFSADLKSEDILKHHNARGSAEKAIEELKNGFALSKLPCGTLKANAAYAQICVLTYNLVSLFKNAALPKGWIPYRIKNLRFRLLCQAGFIVKHARKTILKLYEVFHSLKCLNKQDGQCFPLHYQARKKIFQILNCFMEITHCW